MATRYSDRLGVIADERFQAALDHFHLGRLLGTTPVTRGMFGQNVFLRTTVGEFVLRGSPHDVHQLAHERYFCQLLHERTDVPVPWPYLVDERPDIFGWSYALMPRMPGIHIDDERRAAMTMAERTAVAEAMGDALGRFGTATGPAAGRFRNGEILSAGSPVAEAERWMRERLSDAEQYCPATIAADRPWIEDIVQRGLTAIAQPCPPTVTTTDYGEGNAVVERTGAAWRVSGVFDFYEYSLGDLELALSRPLLNYLGQDPALAMAFLRAFARQWPLRAQALERMAFYTLGDRLIFWNYGHSLANWFAPELPFRAFAEPALAQIRELMATAAV